MRKLLLLLLVLLMAVAAPAQKRHTTAKPKARTTATAKRKTTTKKKAAAPKTAGIKSLESQREQIRRQIAQQEKQLRANQQDVKNRLHTLMVINSEIASKRKSIDTIRRNISEIDREIIRRTEQLNQLQQQLDDKKDKYVRSMRYMHRNRSIQSQLMFIFSASSLTKMFRRMRFMREYATYQRFQGEMVKEKQKEVTAVAEQLKADKANKHTMLSKGERERAELEGKQNEQQNVVSSLQKQQKTLQQVIAAQKKKDAAINAEIDRLIAIEVEKARQRAIAEAKRRAEEEARRQREEEEQRRRELAAKKAGTKNEKSDKPNRSERAERTETPRRSRETAYFSAAQEDRRISGNFTSNKGRLPVPITGSYRVVSHFGQYNVEGLSGVRLDNKGINIQGNGGAQARSIFDGEVSAVFSFAGTTGVMVRHGSYISVYCNLRSVAVHKGQKVSTRQVLGSVGSDNILQFQLRKETAKLNPESWLRL